MTPESNLKLQVTAYLDRTEDFWMRMNSGVVRKGSRFIHLCPEGTADIVVFREGDTAWIELKVEGQTTSKDRQKKQAEFAAKVRAVGHRYTIAKSIDEVKEFLQ